MHDIERVEDVLKRAGDLPAIPDVVSEVLALTEDPDVDMASVVHVIERDPALSAKILRVSNSSYYGMRQFVGTLKLALVVLGVREVRNIVLGICVFDSLHDESADAILSASLWNHSFLVGGMSKKLCSRLRLGLSGEDFISGLLHDIGKLVLVRQVGTPYTSILQECDGDSTALRKAEEGLLGFTHAEAGAILAEHWNFPKTLVDALLLHHPVEDVPLSEAKDPFLAAAVRIANAAARQAAAPPASPSEETFGTEEAWTILARAANPIPPEERSLVLSEFAEELGQDPVPAL